MGANRLMEFQFIADLDEYFCEKYANYDKICVLKGYKMPKMQATKRLENGRDYAYTLPTSTMRLALQENKLDLLADLKTKMADKSCSFSFIPLSIWARIFRRKSDRVAPVLCQLLKKYAFSVEEKPADLEISDLTWKRLVKGEYFPTKNLIFSLALLAGFSYDDTVYLLAMCGLEFDYTVEREVVISYLLKQKIFNSEMIKSAFKEYNVENLFIKLGC